jgi:hypothetical protein
MTSRAMIRPPGPVPRIIRAVTLPYLLSPASVRMRGEVKTHPPAGAATAAAVRELASVRELGWHGRGDHNRGRDVDGNRYRGGNRNHWHRHAGGGWIVIHDVTGNDSTPGPCAHHHQGHDLAVPPLLGKLARVGGGKDAPPCGGSGNGGGGSAGAGIGAGAGAIGAATAAGSGAIDSAT